MTAEIYYFSGTGNSLVVARDIAKKIDGKLTPIPLLMNRECVTTEADVIGIVFPVYNAVFDGMPLIVNKFAGKLDDIGSKYIFAACTCKGWSRVTIGKLGEIIASRGGKLAAGFTVRMPDNSNPSATEERQKMFKDWPDKLESIYRYVDARGRGRYENTVLYNVIVGPFMSRLRKTTLSVYGTLSNTSGLPFEQALPLSDRSFAADENCNGCGTCAGVCPVRNIEIIDRKPVWQHRCESCLACINWCPKAAIHGGIIAANKCTSTYHHPDVKLSDMFIRDAF